MADIIQIVILAGCLSVVAVVMLYARKAKIPPVPVMPEVRASILRAAQIYIGAKPSCSIAELGSGWGGLAFALHRAYPGAEITGYEISPLPFWVAQLRGINAGPQLKFLRDDFFQADLGVFDVLICYLSPSHMTILADKIQGLKPGSMLISNAFPLPAREPTDVITVKGMVCHKIYVYRF